MKIKAFAPGKIILFGEHTVVYKKPAIAVAIDRGVNVELIPRNDDNITVKLDLIDYYKKSQLVNKKLNYKIDSQKKMITDYIYEVINLFEFEKGLGSSAAVTVSTLKAVSLYVNKQIDKKTIAQTAREIEIKIQGAASPIDTSMSTYGGIIFIDENSKLNRIDFNMKLPLIVSNCEISGNTGKLVESVRLKYEKYPTIVGNIFKAMEQIAIDAKVALEKGNSELIGDLMNINQGLLDAIGVNTTELSDMVYKAREYGAKGSKLTGSGGGGCIIAYTPENSDEIYKQLRKDYATFKCVQSDTGVSAEIIN